MKDIGMNDGLGNLKINGIGQAYGGQYRDVKLEGMTRVSGNLRCETFRVNGMSRVSGSIDAGQLSVNGVMHGTVGIIAKSVNIDGKVNVRGSLVSEEVGLNGHLKLDGDCEAEKVIVRGIFVIDGLLNAGTIEVNLEGKCSVKEIGGSAIRVNHSKHSQAGRMLGRIIPSFKPQLHAGVIEGDEVHLEATRASVVRGRNIYIGPDCEIDRVEYEEELIVDLAAQVKERVKL